MPPGPVGQHVEALANGTFPGDSLADLLGAAGFVLRHKVEALVALGRGESYRQSAWNARRSARRPTAPGRTRSFSADRRMTGDSVSALLNPRDTRTDRVTI